MNIRKVKLLLISVLVLSVLVLVVSCQGNRRTDGSNEQALNILDPRSLVVHKEDLAVKIALKNDSLYSSVEESLIEEEGMTQKESTEEVQFMIDNKLLIEPVLSYYHQEGRQTRTFTYAEFKNLIQIVKDSVAKQ